MRCYGRVFDPACFTRLGPSRHDAKQAWPLRLQGYAFGPHAKAPRAQAEQLRHATELRDAGYFILACCFVIYGVLRGLCIAFTTIVAGAVSHSWPNAVKRDLGERSHVH